MQSQDHREDYIRPSAGPEAGSECVEDSDGLSREEWEVRLEGEGQQLVRAWSAGLQHWVFILHASDFFVFCIFISTPCYFTLFPADAHFCQHYTTMHKTYGML